jgi:ribonuclease VapC
MIVDSSALIAILNEEPRSASCLNALLISPMARISAATLLEAAIVVDRHPRPALGLALDALIVRFSILVEPVT